MVSPPNEANVSDLDADGDEDVDMEVGEPGSQPAQDPDDDDDEVGGESDKGAVQEDEEQDAEGEEDEANQEKKDQDGDEDDVKAEYHGAVKVPDNESLASDDAESEASDEDESADGESGSDNSEESSSESEAENEWEGGSAEVEGEVDIAARNNCVFCGQDEEHDPGEEFEEYLACAVCGDNAHRQCARDGNSLQEDTEASQWRCPPCTENSHSMDAEEDEEEQLADEDGSLQRRLSTSSSRLTRDLLPATRGTPKPGSHSIFSTLILDDDPLDGSRALRKRKASSEQPDALVSRASSKRPKRSDGEHDKQASPIPTSHRARSGTAVSRTRKTPAILEDAQESSKQDAAAAAAAAAAGTASTRPQRQRRPKREEVEPVRVYKRVPGSLVLAFRVDMSKVKAPKKKQQQQGKQQRDRDGKRSRPSQSGSTAARPRFNVHAMGPYPTPFWAFHEREEDESKKKPYGGILLEGDADNSRTYPQTPDRAKFDRARQLAEEEWKQKTAAAEAEQLEGGGGGGGGGGGAGGGRAGAAASAAAAQKVAGPPSKIKCINFGGHEIETWYAAPYPEEYSRNRVLYICEFCLKYMGSGYVAWRHKLKCPVKHPPGDEIYRDGSVSVFEVDGRKNPAYCQNLCLLAKLFLGSKTLYYDVEPFLFYIMTEYDELGCHFVGYFSKEKRPASLNNVSCILTLPIHQRKGYGNLLIDFSYLLTRVERKTGSPEKPLSDMGLVSYRNYWRLVLCYLLVDDGAAPMSVADISERTGMTADDIVAALEALRALVRDPVSKTYALRLDRAYYKETIEKWEAKGYVHLNPDALMWTPYVMGRSNLANYDRPALATIAPREGEEDEEDENDVVVVPEEGVQQQQLQQRQQQDEAARRGKPLPDGIVDPDSVALLAADMAAAAGAALPPLDGPVPPLIDGVATAAQPAKPANEDDGDGDVDGDDAGDASPAKAPTAALLTNGIYSSASTSAPEAPQSPIPPTRYELYPPVPGIKYRSRRGGYRPKGSRITPHGPIFMGEGAADAGGGGVAGVGAATPLSATTPLPRRSNGTRSSAAAAVVGTGKPSMGGKVLRVGEAKPSPSLRMTRSQVGTPVPLAAGLQQHHEQDEERQRDQRPALGDGADDAAEVEDDEGEEEEDDEEEGEEEDDDDGIEDDSVDGDDDHAGAMDAQDAVGDVDDATGEPNGGEEDEDEEQDEDEDEDEEDDEPLDLLDTEEAAEDEEYVDADGGDDGDEDAEGEDDEDDELAF